MKILLASSEVFPLAKTGGLADVADLQRTERWKRHALTPIWVFLAFMAIVFWAKRRQLERERKA